MLIMYDIKIRIFCEESNRYRATLEELRQAMLKYQVVFDELLESPVDDSQEPEKMMVD
jgi:hypothetical protein